MISQQLVELLANERRASFVRDAEQQRLAVSSRKGRACPSGAAATSSVLGRLLAGLRGSVPPADAGRTVTVTRLLSHHEG